MSTDEDAGSFAISIDDMETANDTAPDSDEAEWFDFDAGDELVGELVDIRRNCGEYNQRVYELKVAIGEPHVVFWGTASIDRQIDELDASSGDVIGVRHTGETFETDSGHEGVIFEVGVVR